MEKLIELLNEYEKHNVVNWYERSNDEGVLTCRYIKENFLYYCEEATTIAISKYYGFVGWLVENDKIEFELDSIIHKHKGIDFNTGKGIAVEKLCNRYESLLMLLAIQDEPIRFLCDILK